MNDFVGNRLYVYKGCFKNNKRNGFGEYYWLSEYGHKKVSRKNSGLQEVHLSEEVPREILVYKGYWENNIRNGIGEEFCDNKGWLVYRGNWKSGLKDGKGVLYNETGHKCFDGDWKKGKMDGFGKMFETIWVEKVHGQTVNQADVAFFGGAGNLARESKLIFMGGFCKGQLMHCGVRYGAKGKVSSMIHRAGPRNKLFFMNKRPSGEILGYRYVGNY
jgi:antitoxin component YwqK of YwqJK toxin-antitoxin module